jgi:transcriptional regulator with XRE-family HTH domain
MDVTENLSPAVSRRRLRTELRRARNNAGLTQEHVAEAMDWSPSKLIRIENGTNSISTNDLKALVKHYEITNEKRIAELLSLSKASRERSWWSAHPGIAKPLAELIEYESAAHVSRHYQDLVIPGLLQTTDYMRASTRQLAPDLPSDRIDAVVEVRVKRQEELFKRAEAPRLYFVLDEPVIRRVVGGTDVMRRQLQQLIEASDMPNVTVEVVPFTAGLVPGLQTAFVIHEFLDDADEELLYLESPHGDMLIRDKQDEILSYREDFERLREASLGPRGTIDFLHEVIAGLS